MTAREFRERLVGTLQDALCTYIDPAARGHLSVHGQAAVLKVAEDAAGGPGGNQQGVRDDDAGRPGMRAEDRNGLPGLNEERFVVLQAAQRVDDRVKRIPRTRGASRAAIHDQVVGAFRHRRIEIVHQHAQGGFLRPSLAGDGGTAWGADVAAEDAHEWNALRVEGCNLKTYARVVKLILKKTLLDFYRARAFYGSASDQF